jgi:hypothetical protein
MSTERRSSTGTRRVEPWSLGFGITMLSMKTENIFIVDGKTTPPCLMCLEEITTQSVAWSQISRRLIAHGVGSF